MTLDPHKWLYQPFECGAVLVRDGARLRRAFEMTPDYLKDAMVAEGEVNFADLGLQLSRMARAFKIWISIRYFGLDAFRATIDRALDLAAAAQRYIEDSDHLELLLPAHLSIVCFRRRFPGVDDEARLDAMNAALVQALDESGYGLVSSTRLQGRYAIRLCVLNHTSGPRDVVGVLSWLETRDVAVPADDEVQDQIRAHPILDRTASPTLTWGGYPHADPADLATLEAFAGIDETTLRVPRGRLLRKARRIRRAHRAPVGHRSRLLRDPRRDGGGIRGHADRAPTRSRRFLRGARRPGLGRRLRLPPPRRRRRHRPASATHRSLGHLPDRCGSPGPA